MVNSAVVAYGSLVYMFSLSLVSQGFHVTEIYAVFLLLFFLLCLRVPYQVQAPGTIVVFAYVLLFHFSPQVFSSLLRILGVPPLPSLG